MFVCDDGGELLLVDQGQLDLGEFELYLLLDQSQHLLIVA